MTRTFEYHAILRARSVWFLGTECLRLVCVSEMRSNGFCYRCRQRQLQKNELENKWLQQNRSAEARCQAHAPNEWDGGVCVCNSQSLCALNSFHFIRFISTVAAQATDIETDNCLMLINDERCVFFALSLHLFWNAHTHRAFHNGYCRSVPSDKPKTY